ncbi:hypothetical protein VNI00_010445 [Paramarasmius palmivorus]|uniref:Uncharacterized protein n=1 Tax=Paramarasmius palmivorus TaxID=297713 RepID=A0AAW0CJ75_9AGAR
MLSHFLQAVPIRMESSIILSTLNSQTIFLIHPLFPLPTYPRQRVEMMPNPNSIAEVRVRAKKARALKRKLAKLVTPAEEYQALPAPERYHLQACEHINIDIDFRTVQVSSNGLLGTIAIEATSASTRSMRPLARLINQTGWKKPAVLGSSNAANAQVMQELFADAELQRIDDLCSKQEAPSIS